MKKRILLSLVGLMAIVLLSSCGNDNFMVSFNTDNGSIVDSIVVSEDCTINKPSDPTREGYTFEGWYLDSSLTNVVDFEKYTVTSDVTLYAKWKINIYEVVFVSNGGSNIANKNVEHGSILSDLETPIKSGYTFDGWHMDDALTKELSNTKITCSITLYAKWILVQVENYKVIFNSNEGSEIQSIEVLSNSLLKKPEDPTKTGYNFGGWYKDVELMNKWDFNSDIITQNITLYAKWDLIEYENVSYVLNASELETVASLSSDLVSSRFTIKSGTAIRNRTKEWQNPENENEIKEFIKSIKLGSGTNSVTINAPGKGKAFIYVQNGSSSAKTQKISVKDPSGVKTDITFAGTDEGSPIVKIELDVSEGEWIITRPSGTVDIYLIELECSVPKGKECGFEIASKGTVDFLEGQEINYSDLQLNIIYDNGRIDPLLLSNNDLTVDLSAVNINLAGVYNIYVKYKDYDAISYEITVLEAKEILLGFDSIEKLSKQSTAGNTIYYNHSAKEVYALNESYNSKGLCVSVKAHYNNKEMYFLLNENISYSGFDSSTPGKKEITVTYTYSGSKTLSSKYNVYVVDTIPSKVNDTYQVKVDNTYTGNIGDVLDGYNTFMTVQQALDYISSRDDIKDNDKKLMVISEGMYKEKIEITIPNLTIRGAGKDKTIIEWDSLFGITDAGGFIHTTDSTQTVAIREEAVGCTIEDLTISNFYNCEEAFDSVFGPLYAEHRALALLVQADKFIMRGGSLLGYQDTLELFKGRQYFENVYIEGLTDFIFGTNNTTYFKGCTIHTIDSAKGYGGYITAFKGSNKGESDYVKYGAIFDECNFTADENVGNGLTSIGRVWGPYAAVMIMNSNLGNHISKKGSTGANKEERYVAMNAKPTDSTVQFTEYNNTGDGAINQTVAGMRYLSSLEAANYNNFEIIFGMSNGMIKYSDVWNPLEN